MYIPENWKGRNHIENQKVTVPLFILLSLSGSFTQHLTNTHIPRKAQVYWAFTVYWEAVVAQLASARLSEREVSGSIFSDFNVCFDFSLIRVTIALNTRKTEHWQRQGGKGRTVGCH